MPEDMTACEKCGSSRLFHESPEYEGETMTEEVRCEECGAEYEQRWILEARELVRSGS